MSWVLVLVSLAGSVPAGLRWLRVAQREHYEPHAATRFARRWWAGSPANLALAAVGLGGVVAAAAGLRPAAVLPVLVAAVGPIGLGVRGRTGRLVWTERLRRLAVAAGGITAVLVLGAAFAGPFASWLPALAAPAVPLVVDAASAALGPLERRRGERWVASAAERLRSSGARVVAITGSYGKTTTKVYLTHLLAATTRVLASPASFNNRMGLARAVNDELTPDVEVFIAEMGTYGRGEIAELCTWIPPAVAVITAIGPVHLERMGSEAEIVAAKREILADAPVAVLSVDHPLLAAVAVEEEPRRRVVRTSTSDRSVDVCADPVTGEVLVDGRLVGRFDPAEVHAGNVAAALGAIVGLGVDPWSVAERLETLPVPGHRQAVSRSERGFTIIDDTFNSNPAGARAALAKLTRLGVGRRVVVTPGMVELGAVQDAENRLFAAEVGRVATDLVVVGRTNRAALLAGAADSGQAAVIVVTSREEAVAWVRAHLGDGDAVLYENDLPDHYP